MRYRTKPFEIEAVQFTGDSGYVKAAFPDVALKTHLEFGEYVEDIKVWDYLQETWVKVNMFDYVIKGMKGEFYPCAAEVFEAKYEAING